MSNDTGEGPSPAPSAVSRLEANHYYAGLRSASTGPVLICRTSRSVWERPRGPEEYFRPKELKVVGNHDISNVWEAGLAEEVHAALRSRKINWSSTDPVRIGYADEHSGDVILWIGVRPDAIPSFEVAIEAALQCKSIVATHGITDVEVEMREADVFHAAAPQFLRPLHDLQLEPTAEVRMALSATLGIPICSHLSPWAEGSGGFYVTQGDRLLLVTARHVLFPNTGENQQFEYKAQSGMPRKDVLLLSQSSFEEYLARIEKRIHTHDRTVNQQQQLLDNWRAKAELGVNPDARRVKLAEDRVRAATVAKEALLEFKQLVTTEWAFEENRIIGHVVFAPPIVVGAEPGQFTQDVAVVEMDLNKISTGDFAGNAIDLGFEFDSLVLEDKMRGDNVKNAHSFVWPDDRLLRLDGIVSYDDIRRPSMVDREGKPCLIVLKRGRGTGLTVGRANNLVSYVRHYFSETEGEQISKELAILPYKSGAFSDSGDSGAVVVNGAGQLYGLLTGGSGSLAVHTDVTYATPIESLLPVITSCTQLADVRIGVPNNWMAHETEVDISL